MKNLTVLLAALFLTACGAEGGAHRIDPMLQYYVDLYLQIAPTNGAWEKLDSVGWGDPGNGQVAKCYSDENRVKGTPFNTKEIVWVRVAPHAIDGELAAIVAHELAHCLHDKLHDKTVDGLMNSQTFANHPPEWWDTNLEAKIKGLF